VNARQAVQLVAGREMGHRIRSRAFVVSTLLLVAGAVTMVVLTAVLQDENDRRSLDVGIVAGTPTLADSLARAGDQLNVDVRVHALTDTNAAEVAVRDGEVDVAVDGDETIWKSDVDDVDAALVRAGLQSATVAARADAAGVSQAELASLLGPIDVHERVLDPADPDRGIRIGTATVGVILLFLSIQSYGNMVLTGVVEEKSSRVVEVLLNHVRARHLLAGKIVGIGAVGLLQLLGVLAAGVGALVAVRGVDVPKVPADAFVWLVVWFLLGYGLYATAFATAGSLVSRQEDAASVAAPVTLPFLASYLVSFTVAANPDTTFARVLSFVPITAPMIMPVRLAAGDPSVLEVAGSIVLMLVAIAGLVRLAGGVYSRNLLRTGARLSWREAWRGARDTEAPTVPA
jgi:ABC-2 type transport system permease protein